MKTKCNGLLLAGLWMLAACDAGKAEPDKQHTTAPATMKKQALPAHRNKNTNHNLRRTSVINDALDSPEGLKLEAGDVAVRVTASDCEEFTSDLTICNKNVELNVSANNGRLEQTLKPASIFVATNALIYRGTLYQANKPEAHTVVISDVNADGRDDLIIWSGREGSYGGPSFDVYLFNTEKKQFSFSQSFSDLTVGYIGLFSIENEAIRTSSKSGCCLHVYETYSVEADRPELVERITEDATGGDAHVKVTTERLVGSELRAVEIRIK